MIVIIPYIPQNNLVKYQNNSPTMDATQLFETICKLPASEKAHLMRLLQEADKRVCRKAEDAARRAEEERDAKEREMRQEKIAELKKTIRELDEQHTSACQENDLDMVEWVDGQFAAYRRDYGDLYGVAREEIACEDRAARGY